MFWWQKEADDEKTDVDFWEINSILDFFSFTKKKKNHVKPFLNNVHDLIDNTKCSTEQLN